MKNSTILFAFGILGLGGVGAYFYLKGKKTSKSSSLADENLGLSPTKDDTSLLENLGVKTESPKPTPYVAPLEGVPSLTSENLQKALLSLNIDQTRSINELSSPNYIEAKRIAGNMKEINLMMKNRIVGSKNPMAGIDKNVISKLSEQSIKVYGNGQFYPSVPELLTNMSKKVNELGYKVLANYDIEKM